MPYNNGMHARTEKLFEAGYGITSLTAADCRLRQWETHLAASPQASPAMPPATSANDTKVDEFVLKKMEMLIIELLSRSHADLVSLTKEVKDAFHVHMATARITTLIYRAIKDAGEADGVVSSRHREMIKSGEFATNATAQCYSVALPAIQKGAKHSILSAFAQAVKLHGEVQTAWRQALSPVSITAPKATNTPATGHKKSSAKKREDLDFYDR